MDYAQENLESPSIRGGGLVSTTSAFGSRGLTISDTEDSKVLLRVRICFCGAQYCVRGQVLLGVQEWCHVGVSARRSGGIWREGVRCKAGNAGSPHLSWFLPNHELHLNKREKIADESLHNTVKWNSKQNDKFMEWNSESLSWEWTKKTQDLWRDCRSIGNITHRKRLASFPTMGTQRSRRNFRLMWSVWKLCLLLGQAL